MTEKMFVKYIAEKYDITYVDARVIVDYFTEALESALLEGKRVEIHRLGAFDVKKTEDRVAFNPYAQEKINIEGRCYPRFSFTRTFRLLFKDLDRIEENESDAEEDLETEGEED